MTCSLWRDDTNCGGTFTKGSFQRIIVNTCRSTGRHAAGRPTKHPGDLTDLTGRETQRDSPCFLWPTRVIAHLLGYRIKIYLGGKYIVSDYLGSCFCRYSKQRLFTEPSRWKRVDGGEPPAEDPQAGVRPGETSGEEGRKRRP